METKTISYQFDIKATPQQVYDAFMNEKQHAEFTGNAAEIDNREGGSFSAYGGGQWGYTLLLVPHQRIVQAWTHKKFPEGHYSVIDMQLEDKAGVTGVTFHHYATPKSCASWLTPGWQTAYWDKLKNYLEK